MRTLPMSVQERTREIGMIAAMGWSDRRIVALIGMEGQLVGLAGGVLVGLAASRMFDAIPAIGDFVAFKPDARDLVLPLLAVAPLCVLGAAYPAWRAVRMMPAETLRRL